MLRHLPNIISALRIVLVIPILGALIKEEFDLALLLLLVAGVSDALDGYLAKRYGWVSRLGSILDPVADKLLLVLSFLVLGWLGHIPLWLVALVVARDIIIFIGGLAYHFLVGRYDMAPSAISKINTFAQIILGLTVVLSLSMGTAAEWQIDTLVAIVAFTTVISGGDYAWTWGLRAWRHKTGQLR